MTIHTPLESPSLPMCYYPSLDPHYFSCITGHFKKHVEAITYYEDIDKRQSRYEIQRRKKAVFADALTARLGKNVRWWQSLVVMESYQSDFCEDEFYNILETMSPLTTLSTTEVSWCHKCRCAPCSCSTIGGSPATIWITRNQPKKRSIQR